MTSMTKDELKERIIKLSQGLLVPLDSGVFDLMFEVKPANLMKVALMLRDTEDLKFDYLNNVTGVDTGEQLEVVYSLSSISHGLRLDFKVILPYDQATVESLVEVWKAADWHEREIWELYGIDITGHPNLKQFLLPDDWDQGHPMRKAWDAPDFVRMPEL
jgi:NADH-quinone oxidoreductase subunit C